eukprot:GHVS01071601.1.p1 GENE.GHVS01071601.1~~GHVS01071601.1.p1  ORF type:complete len:204 (-),score=39.19 GHVS01071601.1:349-960(-)
MLGFSVMRRGMCLAVGRRSLCSSSKRELLEDVNHMGRQKDIVSVHKLQTHPALQEIEEVTRKEVCVCCEDVANAIKQINQIRVERTQLSSLGYMNSTEQNMEVFGMVVAGFSGCFAAGLHPIFFFGMIGGLTLSHRSRRRENKKQECRIRVEEITSQITQLRADINSKMQLLVASINAVPVEEEGTTASAVDRSDSICEKAFS